MSDNLTELTITTFSKAQIIITRLENSGIECFIKKEKVNQPNANIGVKIYVSEEQRSAANQIMQQLQGEIEMETPLSPETSMFKGEFIVPVDFSSASINACYFAIELAALFKSRIKIIHTYGVPEIRPMSFDDTDFYNGTLALQLDELRNDAEKNLKQLTAKLEKFVAIKAFKDIAISTSIINGLPEEITLFTAEKENANMIIMGVSRKDTRTFEPIGKIASKIISKSLCPVLIIPENSEFNNKVIKNILYATAFDELDFSAIQKLIGFVEKVPSQIFLSHISTEGEDSWDNIKMDGLKDYFSKVYNFDKVFCSVSYSKDILKALDDFIQENSIDILCLLTHKRNLISKLINPGLTHKVLYHTKIPLLVFHS